MIEAQKKAFIENNKKSFLDLGSVRLNHEKKKKSPLHSMSLFRRTDSLRRIPNQSSFTIPSETFNASQRIIEKNRMEDYRDEMSEIGSFAEFAAIEESKEKSERWFLQVPSINSASLNIGLSNEKIEATISSLGENVNYLDKSQGFVQKYQIWLNESEIPEKEMPGSKEGSRNIICEETATSTRKVIPFLADESIENSKLGGSPNSFADRLFAEIQHLNAIVPHFARIIKEKDLIMNDSITETSVLKSMPIFKGKKWVIIFRNGGAS